MANKDGVPDVVGVAPDGPAGRDDIESKPNPEGPSGMWDVSADSDAIWGEEADTMIHIYRNNNGSARLEIVNGHHGILGSITLANWRVTRLGKFLMVGKS